MRGRERAGFASGPDLYLSIRKSDTALTVSGMTELTRRYDVTVTIVKDDGYLPDPDEYAACQPGCVRTGRQRHERAHGREAHQRRHSGSGRPASGCLRRLGRCLRGA
jgi:hypothetical protein